MIQLKIHSHYPSASFSPFHCRQILYIAQQLCVWLGSLIGCKNYNNTTKRVGWG